MICGGGRYRDWLSGRQIGRIADLHATHPQGETHGCVS